jgi:uncharacterized membrane protein
VHGGNLILFFAHFLDASATFVGVDLYGYWEKHVLPRMLIGLFNSAAIMFLLKFLVVLAVIYVLDLAYKDDLKDYPALRGLIKLCILILGIAPGVRDMLRLAMGV